MRMQSLKGKVNELIGKPWMPYVWLTLITLLGVALRLYKLGAWSFWIDEIFTIGHATAHFSTPALILENIPPLRNWVPVSVILTAQVLNAWGITEWSARLTSALIGIITMPVLYFVVRRLFNTQVALITVLLLAVSTWHIEWSQNARFYTSLMLLYTLALIFFFHGLEQDRPSYILIFILLLYLAASERFFAVFILPVVFGYLLLLKILPFEKPTGFRTRNILLTLLPVLAAIIVEIASYIMDGTFRFLGGFDWFFQYQMEDPLRLLSYIGFDVGVPLMCFSFFSGVYLIVTKNRMGLLLLVSAIIPVILLLALNPFVFTLSRYVFMTLPSWIILGAVGIVEVFQKARGQGKILALGLMFILLADAVGSSLLYYRVNNGNRLDWRRAFSLVEEQRQADDELVTWWAEWEGFYWDNEIITWEGLTPDFVMSSGRRFWFIVDNEFVWGNLEMKYWMEQNAELKEVIYLRRENDFNVRIYLYDPGEPTRSDEQSFEYPPVGSGGQRATKRLDLDDTMRCIETVNGRLTWL